MGRRSFYFFLCYLAGLQFFIKNSAIYAAEAKEYDDTTYGFSLSMAKDSFGKLSYFDKLYGKPPFYPNFSVQGYFLDLGFVNLGIRGDLGYSSLSGYAAEIPSVASPTDADITKATQKVYTTVIPYKILATSQFRFFNSDIVGVDAFVGYQEMYMSDVRSFDTDQASGGSRFFSTGWSSSMVYGGGLRFKLNFLDEQSTATMAKSTGFHSVYLNLYVENKVSLKMTKALISRGKILDANFSGYSWGIGFLFLGD